MADHNYLYYPGMPFDSSAILFEEAERMGLRPETLDAFLGDVQRLT